MIRIIKKPKTNDLICRAFKRDFPELVPQAEEIGLRITRREVPRVNGMPVLWLDDTYQLTGYEIVKGGRRFTMDDAREHIQKTFNNIMIGREEIAGKSREWRFQNVIAGMKTVKLQYNMFCSYRHFGGDTGTIFYRGSPVSGAWVTLWNDPVGKHHYAAEVRDVDTYELYGALAESFAAGGAVVAGRRDMSKRPQPAAAQAAAEKDPGEP